MTFLLEKTCCFDSQSFCFFPFTSSRLVRWLKLTSPLQHLYRHHTSNPILFFTIVDTPDFLWENDEHLPAYQYTRAYLEVNTLSDTTILSLHSLAPFVLEMHMIITRDQQPCRFTEQHLLSICSSSLTFPTFTFSVFVLLGRQPRRIIE